RGAMQLGPPHQPNQQILERLGPRRVQGKALGDVAELDDLWPLARDEPVARRRVQQAALGGGGHRGRFPPVGGRRVPVRGAVRAVAGRGGWFYLQVRWCHTASSRL